MGSADKFCLRWNDFEANISSSFRDLRLNQDFFDVSLAVEEDHVIQAHKVILAACSPFFRNVLAKQSMVLPYGHPHPVIYLRGIKLQDLRHVLDFMYHGEVNVAQEDLNAFLAVAEDLQIKGLSQDGKGRTSDAPVKMKKEPGKRGDPPDIENGPPMKKAKSTKTNPLNDESIPVKTEPSGLGDVNIDESFGEGADEFVDDDYGQYGEDFDDGEPLPGTSDGSKDMYEDVEAYEAHMKANISPHESGGFQCKICNKVLRFLNNTRRHIRETHMKSSKNFVCPLCDKSFSVKRHLGSHLSSCHMDYAGEKTKLVTKRDSSKAESDYSN